MSSSPTTANQWSIAMGVFSPQQFLTKKKQKRAGGTFFRDWTGETGGVSSPLFKGQLGVPLTMYPWYVFQGFLGITTHKYSLYRAYIGISHRGTLVEVHPTIPWIIPGKDLKSRDFWAFLFAGSKSPARCVFRQKWWYPWDGGPLARCLTPVGPLEPFKEGYTQ